MPHPHQRHFGILSCSLTELLKKDLSTHEKKYLAILMAVDQWRTYLQHAEFHIVTDHKSLVQLGEQRLHTPWQQKVFSKLLGLQYHIIYRKGADNGVADALSRMPHTQCTAMSVYQPQWLDEVRRSYEYDKAVQTLLRKLETSPTELPHYSVVDGLLCFKGVYGLVMMQPCILN